MKRWAARKTSAVFCLKIASHGVLLLATALLAHLLGVSGFGVYAYAITWTNLLSIPATLGLDRLLVREVAICQTHSNWGLMRGIIQWANRTTLGVAIAIATVAGAIAYFSNGGTPSQTSLAIGIAFLSLPIASLRALKLATLRGLSRTVTGLLPEILLMPLLMILLPAAAFVLLGDRFLAPWAVSLYLASTLITFIVAALLLPQYLPPETQTALPTYQVRRWLGSTLPLMVLGGMIVINSRADILMLGALESVESVGIYRVCIRGAQLITFILLAVNATLAPTAASLYAQNKVNELQQVVTQCSRVISLVAFLTTVLLILGSRWYLSLFGVEFIQGQNALIFLCIGNFVNAATGSVGVLLNMTGHERYTAASVTVSAILNVIGNLILIPRYGIEGAAIATASSTIFVNLVKVLWVRQKLGIDATALGKITS